MQATSDGGLGELAKEVRNMVDSLPSGERERLLHRVREFGLSIGGSLPADAGKTAGGRTADPREEALKLVFRLLGR